ncbi:MAG TPA: hypothetical protein VF881_06255 [Polyangiaceae bacterium]
MKTSSALWTLAFVLAAAPAFAKKDAGAPRARHDPDAGAPPVASAAPPAASAAPGAPEERAWVSCAEHIPPGVTRPVLKEHFPSRGTSGYASALEVTIEHGKGESVLPQGFQVQSTSVAARALGEAGFVIPEVDGGAGPTLLTTPGANGATTKVTIPILLLPKNPGRNRMTLPPVPIAVARASGELLTLCTEPHDVLVEDPTASTPDAKPHPNPPPRQQVEEWTLAKQLTIGALIGAVLAALAAWLFVLWRRRPRPVPPPPPPRPPWEVAFEELFAIRYAGLSKEERFAEHYDRVSDAVRKYLGARYGFDGLETTTREMASILRRVEPPVVELSSILSFLDECDLVKFARFTPSEEDCTRILDRGEHIVRATIPPQVPAPAGPARVPAAVSAGRPQGGPSHGGDRR